jgi:aldehyde:ferredoxin oxidoreductase
MRIPKCGYAGNILRVNLTNSRISTEPTQNFIPKFIGGRGVNQWILFKELTPKVTPFEPANIVCFGTGALVATLVPGAARLNIDSKNPFTGGIGSGNAGGWFAAELKFAGYDHVVIQGRAKEPVYLWIEDDKVLLKPASPLWGKTTGETEKVIKEDLGRHDVEILCIGPAGENIAWQACIVVSGSRVVGRCGLGAIMGSKNLKAIAVKGTGVVGIKQPDEFMALVNVVSKRLLNSEGAKGRKKYGTLVSSPLYNDLSALSYKNYQDDYIPEESFAKISHEVFHNMYEVDRYACTACPTACGHVYFIDRGLYSGTRCLKAEANTVWNFGGKLAVDESSAILAAQEECCQLGLDIDNTSSVIGWAIDCFQNKIISTIDTDGLELDWGSHEVIMKLIRKIAYREGFGNILAEGSLRASQIVGRGSGKYSFHIKGQDLIEGIRSMKGWALGVVVSPRGGTHTRGALATESRKFSEENSQKFFGVKTAGDARTYKGKAKVVNYFEYVHALLDSLGICFFTGNWTSPDGINPDELAQFYSFATGIKISDSELMKAGERIHNVEKMFNVYHAGFSRKDDFPPKRLMEEPVKSGPLKGELLKEEEWEKMLDEYYSLHGWDCETGWPSKEKLEELDLHDCLKKLEQKKEFNK